MTRRLGSENLSLELTMAKHFITERVADLGGLMTVKAASNRLPFTPSTLAHVYIKLDMKPQYENAANKDDALAFLRSVGRAGLAANQIAEQYGGYLLELQGSTLHVGLPPSTSVTSLEKAHIYVADLHWAYRKVFDNPRLAVDGWRMTYDSGKTLVVVGRGVHGDDSRVSLGRSANRPAKYLYAQLERPESDRSLERFHAAFHDAKAGVWRTNNLDHGKTVLAALPRIVEDARRTDPQVVFESMAGFKQVTARALPIAPAGTSTSPSTDDPMTYFGWVMRADLDGFTARVEECFDNEVRLAQLADQFGCIMDAAAQFTQVHRETLAQLPWAGDNFTAAAVFPTKPEYESAIPLRLVELSADFDKDMAETAQECGFGGWAHGIAGGNVHGNAVGNVYIAGITVSGRRFLVGAGEGFGRSTQAFGDIDPQAAELVVYEPDWARLDDRYKKIFERAVTHRGEESTLYRRAKADALVKVRSRGTTSISVTPVTFPGGQTRNVPTKTHSR